MSDPQADGMAVEAHHAPARRPAPQVPRCARVMAVTSGKGGVGKTVLSANLAAALARRGERVLLLDADLGLANLDVVLGLMPRITLHDVFTGEAELDRAIVPAPGDFSVLVAGSGLVEYSRLMPNVRLRLIEVIDTLAPRYDRILIDTGAGISDVVLHAVSLAAEVVVVATPEPTAMTDAYAIIKVLALHQQRAQLRLLVNQTSRPGEGRAVCDQLQAVVDRFVKTAAGDAVTIEFLGQVPADPAVRDAVRRRMLLLDCYPGSAAGRGVTAAAARLAR